MSGHDYYALSDRARRVQGLPPVDSHVYARGNGWAIRSLCRLHDVTGDPEALKTAGLAADWVLGQRAIAGGGFRHDAQDSGGPYLEDTLSMGQAFLALYRSTGDREWLIHARESLAFIARRLRDPRGGFMSAPIAAGATGVFGHAVRSIDQNAQLARLANMLNHYTADASYRRMAMFAMRYVVGAANPNELHSDVLLADRELNSAPIHITVVGGKKDPAAQALHAAALQFPAEYLQVDWWDREEGPLPDAEVSYPRLPRAAAFACTGRSCSTPVYEAAGVARAISAALYR